MFALSPQNAKAVEPMFITLSTQVPCTNLWKVMAVYPWWCCSTKCVGKFFFL